ncbi:ABC transporter family substrate-binding protein [Kutzneria kofuensis]|uniref:Peptide/nickel transport system substrate-binding protein n=1 Tax=Kutzneria kofuensis TaxID=103725 RepID=A0A7W9KFK4_9PSEU|nr:ABC transporter family substrate-binding protein [Kutzneria kofuensis]MBB5891505.1 peptide/nickel transport system substrate-binding protein [Kutzneria kofuensis]
MGRRKVLALAAPVLAAALTLSACGGGGGGAGQLPKADTKAGVNDINPQPDDKIKDGGTLQFPIDSPSANWNQNEVDGNDVASARLSNTVEPWVFVENADASLSSNKDIVSSVDVASTSPQVIEYKINPKAKWSNGRAISWEDFQAQWKALNGTNSAYQVASTTGYEDIGNVEKGSDDQDVKVTFSKPFGEWKSLFSPLYPKELNSDPNEFNTGWVDAPKITAGPFKIGKIDQTAKTVEVVRDPNWWGKKPHLDSILFKVLTRPSLPDAMASGAIDVADTNALLDAITRYKTMQNVKLRQAVAPDTVHMTLNGGQGRILADQKLRQAIFKAVDRQGIANAEIGKITPNPPLLGNHIYAQGTKEYQDNTGDLKYNVDQAKKDLDALGWKMNGQYRSKDGKELDVTYVSSSTPASDDTGKILQQQLAQVGVKVTINAVPTADFFPKYINVGNFDLCTFRWIAGSTPMSGSKGIYSLDLQNPANVQQNYGHVGSQAINDAFTKAVGELDDTKRAQMANDIDKQLWDIAGELPLYQLPGAVATKANVANYGAMGFATNPIDYINIGFTK